MGRMPAQSVCKAVDFVLSTHGRLACLSSDLVTAILEALGEDRFVSPIIPLAENP
jgi:hypothetical protein